MPETLTPLTVDGTNPSGEALLEQCACLVCLYWGAQAQAQAILDLCGGGQILYWFFDPTNPVPCIAFARQGNHYYVWVCGTVNVNQWVGNIQGFLTPARAGGGVLVHSFFATLAARLLSAGESHLPAPAPGIKFTLTGHSLGGAVAQILAVELGRRYGANNVELLTFGQPKAFTRGINGQETWPTYIRVRVLYDPVPMTPPDQAISWFLTFGIPQAAISVAYPWVHYGRCYTLGAGGVLSPDLGLGFWETVPGQWFLTANVSNHKIAKFASLLGVM